MVVNVFGYGTFITKYHDKYPIVAEIEGFKRIYHFNSIYPYHFPFVIKRDGAKVKGIIMHEENDIYLKFWDEYEGYPSFYDRKEVDVKILSDRNNLLDGVDLSSMKTWLYVPSRKTESLTLDRIFKTMRRERSEDYQEMMGRDLWLEKMEKERPEIVNALPELFQQQDNA